MKRVLATIAAVLSMAPFAARADMVTPPDHPALLEEITFLDIRDGGANYRLEALIVRPAAARGKLPIALLTHGKPRLPSDLVKIRAELLSREARDLAYRGYLAVAVVRRGYGVSGGTPGRPTNADFVKCNDADLRKYFSVEADDLERALRVVAARNDADASRVIAIGGSVGGGAMIALAARNPPGLKAVVNLAGAMRMTDASGNLVCPQDMPIAALASFGSRTKTPTLWIYSENDSNFGPDAARKVHAAYVAQGGVATLRIVPSLHPNDGHHVFELPAGRQHWLAALDPFLRAQGLPTWSTREVDTLMQRYNIAPSRRQWLEGYFSLYTPENPGEIAERNAELQRQHPRDRARTASGAGRLRKGRKDGVRAHHEELRDGDGAKLGRWSEESRQRSNLGRAVETAVLRGHC